MIGKYFIFLLPLFCIVMLNSCSKPKQKEMIHHDLSKEMLANTTYKMSQNCYITLSSGKYERENTVGSEGEEPYWLAMSDTIAYGDLNGDGRTDAIVLLAEWTGDDPIYISINAVMNSNGLPKHMAMFELGDRTIIDTIFIKSGIVNVRMHGIKDVRTRDWPDTDSTITVLLKYDDITERLEETEEH